MNGRAYGLPSQPVVVICVDGCDPRYLEHGLAGGFMPTFVRFREHGFFQLGRGVIPSFTNPNNLSIITGVPPSIHGICGNYFFDRSTGREVMMDDPGFLRCPTIPATVSKAGTRTAIVTAKDKLRRLLGHGVHGICFSSERANEATIQVDGTETRIIDLVQMPVPAVYSAELSEFVLAAGLAMLKRGLADLLYLSLTDYVQHVHGPGDPAATAFFAMLDRYFDAFDREGAVLGITADHGMNAKVRADGSANVIFLGPILDDVVGPGRSRIILPITDPYVVHHGALGSFATIYLDDAANISAVLDRLSTIPGITDALDKVTACARFELPLDRMGDVVVLSDAHTALGKSPKEHDLSLLEGPLRTHGGLEEQIVPLLINRPLLLPLDHGIDTRNLDIFDIVLNRV